MRTFPIAGASALLLPALACCALCPAARAQEQIDATVGVAGTVANDGPLPAGGEPLLGASVADPLFAMRLAGRRADAARREEIAVSGQPFARAVRVSTPANLGEDAVVLTSDVPGPVRGGDTLFLRVWARTAEGGDDKGESPVTLTVNKKGDYGQTVFFGGGARFGREWRRFDLPVRAWRRFPEGVQLSLRLGAKEARVVELVGLEAVNYGSKVLPHQLPYKRATYPGRAPGAPWRKAAQERIEKHRKGDLTVTVLDAKGRPVPGAAVKVAMKRHAYRFGSAVSPSLLAQNPNGERYRSEFKRLFNEAVIENNLKWRNWERPEGRADALKMLDWLNSNGFSVRGHTAVYPAWRHMPESVTRRYDEVKAGQGEAAAKKYLNEAVEAHLTDIITATRGKVVDWDVVNETVGGPEVLRILGRPAMIPWYKRVREIDPKAVLYLNENSVENGRKLEPFVADLKLLIDGGAPVGGAGLQGHVGALPPDRVYANIDAVAKLGLPIKITEFDMVTPDEQLQADYTRDFLTLVFSHPATQGFLMWGFWDGGHWLRDAPIHYQDWTVKPSGRAYEQLVLRDWWTSAQGRSNKNGSYAVRGFLGDYEVTVTDDKGRTKTVRTSLPREGARVEVRL